MGKRWLFSFICNTYSFGQVFKQRPWCVNFCLKFIDEFFDLKKEIMNLPEVIHFPMICLNCEDLKQGLASNAKAFAKMLMDRIVANYREENEK